MREKGGVAGQVVHRERDAIAQGRADPVAPAVLGIEVSLQSSTRYLLDGGGGVQAFAGHRQGALVDIGGEDLELDRLPSLLGRVEYRHADGVGPSSPVAQPATQTRTSPSGASEATIGSITDSRSVL